MTDSLSNSFDHRPDAPTDSAPMCTPEEADGASPQSPAPSPAAGPGARRPKPQPVLPATPEAMRDALAGVGYPAPEPVDLLDPQGGPYSPGDYLGAVAAQADVLTMPALRAAVAAALGQTKTDARGILAGALKGWAAKQAAATEEAPHPDRVPHFLDLTDEERETERDRAWEACSDLAQEADILACADLALAAAGVIGETRVTRAVLLAGVARLTSKPVSLSIKGASSSGKSFTVSAALSLLPSHAVFRITAASERALIFLPPGSLRHVLVLLTEATAIQGKNEHGLLAGFIRQLQSEGRLNYPITEKRDDGEGFETRTVHQDGPTGLIVTTTAEELHAENETRQITVETNDTPEQTRRILRAIADRAEAPPVDTTTWHALFRWLELGPREAVVPFAAWLAEKADVSAVRMRRDFDQLLSLVRASALLHRATRKQDSAGRVVATAADYRIALAVIEPSVATGAGLAVSAGVARVWGAVHKRLAAEMPDLPRNGMSEAEAAERVMGTSIEYPIRQLAKDMGRDASVAQRHLAAAVKAGVLFVERSASGGPSRITLAVSSLPARSSSAAVFPRADELDAARGEWDAAQQRARTERLLATLDGPLEYDDDQPDMTAPAAPDESAAPPPENNCNTATPSPETVPF